MNRLFRLIFYSGIAFLLLLAAANFWEEKLRWAGIDIGYHDGTFRFEVSRERLDIRYSLPLPFQGLIAFYAISVGGWVVSLLDDSKPGVCAKSGYDLRATPDRCPECGTARKQTA